MSYIPQNLTDGTMLTAAHLNHVDAGIAITDKATVFLTTERITAIEEKLNELSQSNEP